VYVRVVPDARVASSGQSPAYLEGLGLLHPEDQVFGAMLTGWRQQQLARRLAFSTIEQRERMVQAFAAHAQQPPWAWTAQHVDEWMTDLRAVRHVRASTMRGYQIALRLFCSYITDSAYDWPAQCQQRFGTQPHPGRQRLEQRHPHPGRRERPRPPRLHPPRAPNVLRPR
jgi:hypothetical protein